MRPTHIYTPALLFAATTSAWPSLWAPVDAVKREIEPLVLRQEATKTSFDLSYSATEGQVASTSSSDSALASATGTASTTGTASITGSETVSGSASGSSGSTNHTTQSSISFDARLGPGGLAMITPNPFSAASYYKIKDHVTFAWNYTSLSVTPSAVDILAYGSLNSVTYTLAMNQSVPTGPTQAFTWDTNAFQSSASIPLLTEKYTLIIHDAAKDATAAPSAGYLGTVNQFIFGMYVPQPYTDLSDWTCATCSGAMTSMEKKTLGFVFGMAAITVLSFGWFAGVAGLW